MNVYGPYSIGDLKKSLVLPDESVGIQLLDWSVSDVPWTRVEPISDSPCPDAPRPRNGYGYLGIHYYTMAEGDDGMSLTLYVLGSDGKWRELSQYNAIYPLQHQNGRLNGDPYLGFQIDGAVFPPAPDHKVDIQAIAPSGPAHDAGLQVGDIVLVLAGHPINDRGDMLAALFDVTPGRTVPVTVLRHGSELTLQIIPIVDPLWEGAEKGVNAANSELRRMMGPGKDWELSTIVAIDTRNPVPLSYEPLKVTVTKQ